MLDENLQTYRNWLLNITICDPACGSGAFLNQALEFLIEEHTYIDELESQLLGHAFEFPGVENHILEKNIFGVDINDESVDIAKLSLWLRTAQKGRKLTSLNNNIKCGNSLIDDPSVAGEKAFNWQKEFPTVFVEKEKKAFHITTATHDSRTSQRMVDYKVRQLRDNGLNPKAQPIWLELEDELLITKTVAEIVKEDELNVMAFNSCGDHMHLLLVCEEEEVTKIVGKIKGKTSRIYNSNKGINPLVQKGEEKSVPLWTQKFGCKEITDEKQLWNTVEYIKNNRIKHELPPLHGNKGINPLVEIENELFYCSYEHAFRTEYKGGFDVVIGNPPYGAKISKEQINYLVQIFGNCCLSNNLSDTYIAFYIKTLMILIKDSGVLGFIAPNTWRLIESGNDFRKFILNQMFNVYEIVQHTEKVFEDATVDVDSVFIKKFKPITVENYTEIIIGDLRKSRFNHSIQQQILKNQNSINLYLTNVHYSLINKVNISSNLVSDYYSIKNGVKPYEKGKGKPPQTGETMKLKPFTSELKIDDSFSPLIGGSSFHKYKLLWDNDYWIKYGEWLAAPRDPEIFKSKEKLIFRQTSDKIIGTLIGENFIMRNNTHIILSNENSPISLKALLSILNSKLVDFYYWTINPEKGEVLAEVKAFHLGMLPFPKGINTNDLDVFGQKMLDNNTLLQSINAKFNKLLQSKFEIEKLTTKLQNWHELEFGEFLKELQKAKVQLSLSQEAEWMQYFNEQKQKAQTLKAEIEKTDKEIDKMIYQLYGLSEEEIKIVEGENGK